MKPFRLLAFSVLLAAPAFAEESNDRSSLPQLKGYFRVGLVDSGDTHELQDASSRIGLHWKQPLSTEWQALATLQVGVNVTGNEPGFTAGGGNGFAPAGSGDEVFWPRLGFVGAVSEKWGSLTAGKQWSSYYDITSTTDVLEFWGGEASGTYNFRTDGGPSGTGRADKAIQYRVQLADLQLSVQHKAVENEIDLSELELPSTVTATYSVGNGISLRWHTDASFGVGAAWNESEISVQDSGVTLLTGKDMATAATIYFGDSTKPGLYAALVLYRGENHEIDDAGILFDSEGAEFVLQWTFADEGQIYLAGNQLDPRNGETAYRLDYTVLGYRKTIAGPLMLSVEYKAEQSINAAGESLSDAVFLGAKYSF